MKWFLTILTVILIGLVAWADVVISGSTALEGETELRNIVGPNLNLVDLVSWWRLDEASGTREDAHGTNDLTDNNTVGQSFAVQTSTTTNSASFVSASSEWLNYAAFQNPDFATTNDWCIGGWFRTPETGATRMLAARDDGAGTLQRGWILYVTTGNVHFDVRTNDSSDAVITGSETISANRYYFVFAYMQTNGSVGLWTALTNAAGFTMDTNVFPPLSQNWATNSNLTFGRRGFPSFEAYYDGLLDEWFYYRRKISSNEVWNIFSNKKSYPP